MRCLAFLLLCAVINTAQATGQIPDSILFEGRWYSLFANPLDSYLKKHGRPAIFAKGLSSSANWRGYRASWSIRDGRLYLLSVRLRFKFDPENGKSEWTAVPISEVIPNAAKPVLADWFTGLIRVPKGNELLYVHMGYGSIYEREQLISIKSGVVTQSVEISNTLDAHSECEAIAREFHTMADVAGADISGNDLQAEVARIERQCMESK